jgi:hypothetical protein
MSVAIPADTKLEEGSAHRPRGRRILFRLESQMDHFLMMHVFGLKEMLAAADWLDAEAAANPDELIGPWFVRHSEDLRAQLPEDVREGVVPRNVPDAIKPALSRFVLLNELFHAMGQDPAYAQGGNPPMHTVREWWRSWWGQSVHQLERIIADMAGQTDGATTDVRSLPLNIRNEMWELTTCPRCGKPILRVDEYAQTATGRRAQPSDLLEWNRASDELLLYAVHCDAGHQSLIRKARATSEQSGS